MNIRAGKKFSLLGKNSWTCTVLFPFVESGPNDPSCCRRFYLFIRNVAASVYVSHTEGTECGRSGDSKIISVRYFSHGGCSSDGPEPWTERPADFRRLEVLGIFLDASESFERAQATMFKLKLTSSDCRYWQAIQRLAAICLWNIWHCICSEEECK